METRSDRMKEFIEVYQSIAGQWHDEAGVKVYALASVLRVLQKTGSAALSDINKFIAAANHFSIDNPLSKKGRKLQLTGKDIFGQKQQISVPFTINTIDNGILTSETY